MLVIAITVPTAYAALNPTKERFGEACYNKETDGKPTFADFSCAVNIYQMYFDIISLFDKTDTLDSKIIKVKSQIDTLFTKSDTLRNADKVTTGKLNRVSNNVELLENNLNNTNTKITLLDNSLVQLSNSTQTLDTTLKNTINGTIIMATSIDDLKKLLNLTTIRMNTLDERLKIFEGLIPNPSIALSMKLSTHDLYANQTLTVSGNADPLIFKTVSIAIHNPSLGWFYFEQHEINHDRKYSTTIIPDKTWINGKYDIEVQIGNQAKVADTFKFTARSAP